LITFMNGCDQTTNSSIENKSNRLYAIRTRPKGRPKNAEPADST
jgi:hypothetical protein